MLDLGLILGALLLTEAPPTSGPGSVLTARADAGAGSFLSDDPIKLSAYAGAALFCSGERHSSVAAAAGATVGFEPSETVRLRLAWQLFYDVTSTSSDPSKSPFWYRVKLDGHYLPFEAVTPGGQAFDMGAYVRGEYEQNTPHSVEISGMAALAGEVQTRLGRAALLATRVGGYYESLEIDDDRPRLELGGELHGDRPATGLLHRKDYGLFLGGLARYDFESGVGAQLESYTLFRRDFSFRELSAIGAIEISPRFYLWLDPEDDPPAFYVPHVALVGTVRYLDLGARKGDLDFRLEAELAAYLVFKGWGDPVTSSSY